MNSDQSLADAEQESFSILNVELHNHLNATELAYNLICYAINSFPEVELSLISSSFKVAVSLLTKISNDIRCASLLALKGYSIQSASIISSMYESSFMVAYIENDEDRAIKWIEHENPKKLFITIYDLTQEVIKNFNVTDIKEKANQEYSDYRQLCMVKHGNPLIQMQHGYHIQGNNVLAINGPDHSETSIRVSWFALEKSINYVLISLGSFINNHLTTLDSKDLVNRYQRLIEVHQRLNQLAVERWGTEDPYQGKL